MGERFVNARVRVMLLAGVLAACALVAAPGVRGQNASAPVSPMSSDRAQQFIDAAARGLGYLPGEAIVRFAPGTTVAPRRLRPPMDRRQHCGGTRSGRIRRARRCTAADVAA
jgi:hypothetical protein